MQTSFERAQPGYHLVAAPTNGRPVLKGRGFSCATNINQNRWALAPEESPSVDTISESASGYSSNLNTLILFLIPNSCFLHFHSLPRPQPLVSSVERQAKLQSQRKSIHERIQ